MRSVIIAAALTFAVIFDCQAAMNSTVNIYGVGNMSCGDYVKDRKEKNIASVYQYKQWVYGYFTAISAYVPEAYKKQMIDDESPAGFLQWLENWCADNPMEDFYNAALALKKEKLPIDPAKSPNKKKRNSSSDNNAFNP